MKRNRQKLYKSNNFDTSNYRTVIWITVGVVLVFAVFYFLTALGTGEIKFGKKNKDKEEVTEIQYQEILAGETFNRNVTDYYVFYYDPEDIYSEYYLSLISNYKYKSNSLPFFTVDLSKTQNKEYVAEEETKTKPTSIDNLKVSNPTIIRIRNKQVFDYITGKDAVINLLNK